MSRPGHTEILCNIATGENEKGYICPDRGTKHRRVITQRCCISPRQRSHTSALSSDTPSTDVQNTKTMSCSGRIGILCNIASGDAVSQGKRCTSPPPDIYWLQMHRWHPWYILSASSCPRFTACSWPEGSQMQSIKWSALCKYKKK